jgi:hypothetical protein
MSVTQLLSKVLQRNHFRPAELFAIPSFQTSVQCRFPPSPSRRAQEGGQWRHDADARVTQRRKRLDVASPQPHVAQPGPSVIREGKAAELASWEGAVADHVLSHLDCRALSAALPSRPFHLCLSAVRRAHHRPLCLGRAVFLCPSRIGRASPRRTPGEPLPVATRVPSTWHPALAHAGHVPASSASPLHRINVTEPKAARHTDTANKLTETF